MKPLYDGSAIYMNGLIPVCEHGVGYPDVCSQCKPHQYQESLDRVFMMLKADLILWRILQRNR